MKIEIPDEELLLGIKNVVNPPSLKERKINKSTLESIRYLNLNNRKIKDLRGIEWCKNVEVLYLADNCIQDISLLTQLKKLRLLDLSINPQIHWVSLTKPLHSVEQLFLRSCELSNDLVLESFPNVRQVSLFHNNLKHIEFLYDLKHLDSADLLHNSIPVEELDVFYNQTGVGIMEKKLQ